MPQATAASIAEPIVALRRQRWTGKHIAYEVGVSPATVSRVLKRAGLSRLSDIEPAEPIRRYEREHPGEIREKGERYRLPQGGARLLSLPRRFDSARHDRQRLPATDRRPSPRPAAISVSSTSGQGHIRPRPMARPSASSRRHCENGPTQSPIPLQITAPLNRLSGCTDTTGIAHTAA